jgi:hypothetical protein
MSQEFKTKLSNPETEHFKCEIESYNPIVFFETGAYLNYVCERKVEIGQPHYMLPTTIFMTMDPTKLKDTLEESLKDKVEPKPVRGVF